MESASHETVRREADGGQSGLLATGLALLASAVALFLIWKTASSLLTIFAGILFAAFLDATTRALRLVLPVSRVWRLSLVLATMIGLSGLGMYWGVGKFPEQTRVLLAVMSKQVDVIQQWLLHYGVDLLGPEGGRDFTQWLVADQRRLLTHAQALLGGASGIVTSALIIIFLGIMFAFSPATYRDSLVILVKPSYRARVRAVLDEMGNVLRLWFVGQVFRIALMTLCVGVALYLIGLPGPFLLGLQAGLSNFVPYLGPIAAGIPVALVAMPLGGSVLVWSIVIYTVIQSIEGYIVGPLIQGQAVETPPAFVLGAIVVLGALFGVMGIALAMPLVAIGRVAILRFYVEDYLGDARPTGSAAAKP